MTRKANLHSGGVRIAMAAALFVAAGLVVPVALPGAPGLIGGIPESGAAAADAVRVPGVNEPWIAESSSGSLDFTATDVGWIDIAYPVTNETTDDTVDVRVRWTWQRPYSDDAQIYLCHFFGQRFDGNAMTEQGTKGAGCHVRTGDGSLEADAEVLGEGAEVDVPRAYCEHAEAACYPSRAAMGTDSDHLRGNIPYEYLLDEGPDPVAHEFVWVGGVRPDEVHVEVTWSDTELAVTMGSAEDAFTFFRDDFNSDLYARVDTPAFADTGTYYQAGAELNRTLIGEEDQGRSVMFRFDPKPNTFFGPLKGEWGYERPHGSKSPQLNSAMWEASDQVGAWSFWYNTSGSASDTKYWLWQHDPDDPVLVGTVLDWAKFPWESGS